MKLVPITLLILFSISAKAQNFDSLLKKGELLYSRGNFDSSAIAYENAFRLKEGNATQYYNAACSWALSGEKEMAFKNLKLAAEKGWTNVKHIQRDKDLFSLHEQEEWKEIIAQVQNNLNEYEKDFDRELKAQLELIYVRDQTLRQLYQDAELKFGRDSEEMKYFWSLVSREDSLNEIEVIKLIEERGWPGRSLVGGQANMAVWLVIQHAPIATQEKYLPLLIESVKNGESSGSHLALLEDRILMRNAKPQKYGSQTIRDPKTGKNTLYELEDPENVDQRRKEVGLGPLKDYLKRMGVENY